jgi:hypothetical protein
MVMPANLHEMHYLHEWLNRKLRAPRSRLCEPARATEVFRRHTGPRYLFGQVTLSAVPAAEFSYESRVTWPANEQVHLYEDCVLDGILDVLLIGQTHPILSLAVTLEEMAWHEIDSCALAYGLAAQQAMRRIIVPEWRGLNYEPIPLPSV